MRYLVAFLLLVTLAPAARAEGDLLTTPKLFTDAWTELTDEIGAGTDLFAIEITPKKITVDARSREGGPRVDRWEYRLTEGLLASLLVSSVAGPEPLKNSGPVGDVESGFFRPGEIGLDRLHGAMGLALEQSMMMEPGHVARVSISRRVSLIPRPAYADIRWRIEVANKRESAVAEAVADGTVIGVDISQTLRGANRDFLSQADWPFEVAGRAFHNLIGDGEKVWELEVSRRSVSVQATSPQDDDYLVRYSWDGGRVTQGLVPTTNTAKMVGHANLPYPLSDLDLTAVPKVLAAARAAVTASDRDIFSARAMKEPVVTGTPETLWLVRFRKPGGLLGAKADEETLVRLRPDGEVVSVLLPLTERPKTDYLSAPGVMSVVGQAQKDFGGQMRVYQLMLREGRGQLSVPSKTKAGFIDTVLIEDTGMSTFGQGMPAMMETDADLFALEVLNALDAEKIAMMKGETIGRMGDLEAKVQRITIWSGRPFFQSPDGRPLIEFRVGRDDRNHIGRAVFTLDGQFLEAVK